jgi:hypothetical protein
MSTEGNPKTLTNVSPLSIEYATYPSLPQITKTLFPNSHCVIYVDELGGDGIVFYSQELGVAHVLGETFPALETDILFAEPAKVELGTITYR